MKKRDINQSKSPSQLITKRIAELGDPKITEERKWRKPTIVCTGESYKNHVRFTFPKGASIRDPDGIFNSNPEGNSWRAIVLHRATR